MKPFRLSLPSPTPPGEAMPRDALPAGELRLEGAELTLAGPTGTRRRSLAALRAVRATPEGIWLDFPDAECWFIAGAAFGTAAEREAFVAELESAAGSAAALIPGPAAAPPRPDATGESGALRAFGAHLLIGLRAALLVPVDEERLTVSAPQAVLLLLALALANMLGDTILVGRAGMFNPDALPGVLFPLPLFILLAAAGRFLVGLESAAAVRLVVLGLCIAPWVEFGSLALTSWDTLDQWLTQGRSDISSQALVRAVWLALALASVRRGGQSFARRFAMALAGGLLVAAPLASIPYDDVLWASRTPAEDPGGAAANTTVEDAPGTAALDENFVYRENLILDQALAALQPPRPDRINLYWVGFAGASSQDVFMKEVQSIRALFETRFGARGHAIALINNPDTLGQVPIATHVSLEAALRRIGRMIDPARDIVFVYLTSHGSRDHLLTVDLPPLELSDIAPAELRALLDAAGIRNRVIVVSACYSGGFIGPLQTDWSLVITAARSDRTSFGCSNEEDFTYFGRAYFDEALRSTTSFVEAYRRALPVIAEREAAQHFVPSEPQLHEGARIGRILDQFDQQLAATPRAAGDSTLNR